MSPSGGNKEKRGTLKDQLFWIQIMRHKTVAASLLKFTETLNVFYRLSYFDLYCIVLYCCKKKKTNNTKLIFVYCQVFCSFYLLVLTLLSTGWLMTVGSPLAPPPLTVTMVKLYRRPGNMPARRRVVSCV